MSILEKIERVIDSFIACIPRKKPSIDKLDRVKLIAHRGLHSKNGATENTIEAFDAALTEGCWGIEFDVHATADGILVVNHDADLSRLWQRDNTHINQLSWQELHQLAPNIPTLAQVVNLYGKRMHLFIELKEPFTAYGALANDLQELTPIEDFHIISLDAETLFAANKFPLLALMLVANAHNTAKICQLSLEKKIGGVLGHYLLLTQQKIKRLTHANQQTGVGFVDSKYSLYREVNRNIDWLFTNKVKTVKRYLS